MKNVTKQVSLLNESSDGLAKWEKQCSLISSKHVAHHWFWEAFSSSGSNNDNNYDCFFLYHPLWLYSQWKDVDECKQMLSWVLLVPVD